MQAEHGSRELKSLLLPSSCFCRPVLPSILSEERRVSDPRSSHRRCTHMPRDVEVTSTLLRRRWRNERWLDKATRTHPFLRVMQVLTPRARDTHPRIQAQYPPSKNAAIILTW